MINSYTPISETAVHRGPATTRAAGDHPRGGNTHEEINASGGVMGKQIEVVLRAGKRARRCRRHDQGRVRLSETAVHDAELLAIEEINASGGVMGKQIEVVRRRRFRLADVC